MSEMTDKWRAASRAARKSEHHWQADCLAEAADALDGMADWRPPARADETAQEALADLLFWQLDHSAETWEMAGDVIAAGWRPPAEMVTKVAALDALPIGTVVHNTHAIYSHVGGGWWLTPGDRVLARSETVLEATGDELAEAPATVLWTPEAVTR